MYVIAIVILAVLLLCSCKKKTYKRRRVVKNPFRRRGGEVRKVFKLNEIEKVPEPRPTYCDYPDFSKLTWASDSSHAKTVEGTGFLDNAPGRGIITPMRQKKGDQTIKMASCLQMLRWQTE
jgi:hypothetical protein